MGAELAPEAYSGMRSFRLDLSGVRSESLKRAKSFFKISLSDIVSIATGLSFSLVIACGRKPTIDVPILGLARS